jgi:hypothetical protein
MQDLDVIIRQNAKAVQAHAAKEAQAGKHVLVKYTGLNFYDYEAFDNERDRNYAATQWTKQSPGHRAEHLNPPKVAAVA